MLPRFFRRKPRTVSDVLEDLGLSADEIAEAERSGTDELLAIDGVVLPERATMNLDELADKVGADVEVVRAFWRGLGFVDPVEGERSFSRRDVSILRSVGALTREGFVDQAVALQVIRVLGLSMAQVATAVVDASETRSGERPEGAEDPDSFALRAPELLPVLSDLIDYSFRRHLRAAARRRVVLASSIEGAGQVVGFADLVRFTELSMLLDDGELAQVVGRFDQLVNECVVRHGGRVVKMIGDGAMFSVVDPVTAGLIALELADGVAADDRLPGLRVGMASGEALARDGDLYGPVVNLANRLVEIGRAGAVNVSQEVRDAIVADDRFLLRSLGKRSLRHIGDVRVYRLRPGSGWMRK